MTTKTEPGPGRRGPAEHAVRNQIIEAAHQCFALNGYHGTTVSALARQIGFSKAYIYRFFPSKEAIAEAICSARLERLLAEARAAVDEPGSAADRLKLMFSRLTTLSVELFFEDRQIYEIAAMAAKQRWPAARSYVSELHRLVAEVIRQGRSAGEFERKTPSDEICRSIIHAMTPFTDPLHLERNLNLLPHAQNEMLALILRSLAP